MNFNDTKMPNYNTQFGFNTLHSFGNENNKMFIEKGNNRQFGNDITNINTRNSKVSQVPNKKLQEKNFKNFYEKKSSIVTNTLSRKSSIDSRKFMEQNHMMEKKGKKPVNDVESALMHEIDNSAKNLKMEICNNSFDGSSMNLDGPIKTRNQTSELLTKNSPQLALEYIEDILKCLIETENNYRDEFYPKPEYMRKQKDINDKMRAILFDWLVDVHLKWKLLPETLFITFNIIDRYLTLKHTPRDELQCVGVAGLLIACKYEEIYFPELSDFKDITDNAFSKKEILQKEIDILGTLKYDITVPLALRFFEVFNVWIKLESRDKAMALYLIEICSYEYSMLKYKPSTIAVGVLFLIISYNKSLRDMLFMIVPNYDNDEVLSFVNHLNTVYYQENHGSKSLKRKYSQTKYHEVGKADIISELTNRFNLSNAFESFGYNQNSNGTNKKNQVSNNTIQINNMNNMFNSFNYGVNQKSNSLQTKQGQNQTNKGSFKYMKL